MKLNLSADNLSTIRWWVSAFHAIYKDCCGHTGAMISLCIGAAISFSNKQKINTKSFTKSEIVGTDQALSSILHIQSSLKPRSTLLNKTFYSKTINQQCIKKSTDNYPAQNAPNKSNVANSSFMIKLLLMAILRFYIALLKLCGPMFSLNPNKVDPSALIGATS
jgi:hypothetical protein